MFVALAWRTRLQRRWPDIACAAGLVLVSGVFMARAFAVGVLGQYPSDGTRIHYFTREFTLGELSQGRLPLWNPYTQFGAPFLANMQWGVFSPLNVLLTRFSSDAGYNLFVFMNLAMAGVFMYVLARGWKLSRGAAVVAGLTFMLSGRLVAWAWGGALYMLSAVVWLPLVVLLFTRALAADEHRGVWIGVASVAAAAQILSGHPQTTFFTACVAAICLLDRLIETRRRRRWIWPVAAAACIAVLALGLSAVQLAPTYEAMRLSTRAFDWGAVSTPASFEGSYNPLRFASWLVPDLFGNTVSLRPASTDWLSLVLKEPHSDEYRGYIGVLPLVLACFSLTEWRTNRRVIVLWTLVGASVLLALGHFTPLYKVMYAAAPPLRTFRIPARFLTITVFGTALLAGFGVDALERRERLMVWVKSLAMMSALLAIGAAGVVILRTPLLARMHEMAAPLFVSRPSGRMLGADAREALIGSALTLAIRGTLISAGLLAAAAATFRFAVTTVTPARIGLIVIALTALDLGLQASMYTSAEPMRGYFARNAPLIRALHGEDASVREYTLTKDSSGAKIDLVAPSDNVFMHERLITAGGYDSFELETYRTTIDLIDADLRSGSSYLAGVFGLRYVVTNVNLGGPSFEQVGTLGTAGIYRNSSALPRFYVAPRARRVASNREAVTALQEHQLDAGNEVIVESSASLPSSARARGGRVTVVALAPTESRLAVRMDGDGYLVANDSYYPGWTATVDGQSAPLFRANGHVRAIPLTAGDHAIVMRFVPPSLRLGAWISAGFAVITLLVSAFGALR